MKCLFSQVSLRVHVLLFYLFSLSNYVFLLLILSFILHNPVTSFPFQIIYSCSLICHSYYVFLLFIFPLKWCIPVTYSILQIKYSCYLFYLSNYALVLLILSFVLCPPVLNPWNKTFSVSSTVYTQYSKVFRLFKEGIIRTPL